MNLKIVLLIGILSLATFLRLYQLPETMMFIGDQAWYYLSARDMLLTGNIPLVGIPSSHPWLHQGAYWTYVLVPLFALFQFHPLAPGYFVALLGIVTVYLMYKVAAKMFSERIGLIAATLYATSPLIVFHERMPYHTSLISLLTLLFVYSLYNWVKGNAKYFPVTIFLLAVLYNFQISTTPLLAVLMVFVAYGFWKKKKYFTSLVTRKFALLSLIAWFIPMIPMLLYDVSHGFPQTVKFVLWVGYKFALLFGFPSIYGDRVFAETVPFLPFTIIELQRLLFLPSAFIAIGILFTSLGYLSFKVYIAIKKKKPVLPDIVLLAAFIIPFISYFAIKTPSGAYFPMFFPTFMLVLAIIINSFIIRIKLKFVGFAVVLFFTGSNVFSFLNQNFLMGDNGYGSTFKERIETSKEIVNKAEGMRYNILKKGSGSQFDSSTMNYEYLTWWLGNGPSDKPEKLKFTITK